MVIGILIALQVNDWNETRKNQKTEQTLLKALLQEFQSNLEILDQAIELNNYNISKGQKLGEVTGPSLPDGVNQKDLSDLMVGVFKNEAHFFPN